MLCYVSALLYFVAVGCTNLIPPEDAWIKREDDKIIIGCYTSRQTWQLRCHDGRWTGVVSNCSQGALHAYRWLYSEIIGTFFYWLRFIQVQISISLENVRLKLIVLRSVMRFKLLFLQ